MILLIEGMNVTGKSTLAKAFSETLQIPILKFNVPPVEAYAYFRDGILTQVKASPHFIIDRCHLSNYAYRGTLGGGTMKMVTVGMIDNLLHELNAWLFLMMDSPNLIAERLTLRTGRSDQAENLTTQQIGDIQNRFIDCFNLSRIEVKAQYALPLFIDEGHKTDQFYRMVAQMRATIDEQTYAYKGGVK
jgi:thymidylate kinase